MSENIICKHLTRYQSFFFFFFFFVTLAFPPNLSNGLKHGISFSSNLRRQVNSSGGKFASKTRSTHVNEQILTKCICTINTDAIKSNTDLLTA